MLSSHALDFAFRENNHALIQAKMTGLIFDLCFGLKRAVHYANPTPPRAATRVTLHIWRARILNLQIRHLCLLSNGAHRVDVRSFEAVGKI